ncbi:MAG: hypothetical protein ACK5L5_05720 [Bacteroidales bacterium]
MSFRLRDSAFSGAQNGRNYCSPEVIGPSETRSPMVFSPEGGGIINSEARLKKRLARLN